MISHVLMVGVRAPEAMRSSGLNNCEPFRPRLLQASRKKVRFSWTERRQGRRRSKVVKLASKQRTHCYVSASYVYIKISIPRVGKGQTGVSCDPTFPSLLLDAARATCIKKMRVRNAHFRRNFLIKTSPAQLLV